MPEVLYYAKSCKMVDIVPFCADWIGRVLSTKVLIIEDDMEMNRLLQLDLTHHGYEVMTATTGLDGLRLFHETRPDLVVLDVALPGMNGMTVCQRIRELFERPDPDLTAHAITEEEMAEGLNLGADEYMIKPLRNLEFHARATRCCAAPSFTAIRTPKAVRYADDYLVVDSSTRGASPSTTGSPPDADRVQAAGDIRAHKGQVLTSSSFSSRCGLRVQHRAPYPRIYVSHLRRKIEPDAKNPTYIQTNTGSATASSANDAAPARRVRPLSTYPRYTAGFLLQE